MVGPVGHERSDAHCRRDGRALKVFGLAGGVFWQGGDSHIEAGKAGEAAEDEEGEEELVQRRAESDGKGGDGGRDAE